MVEGGRRRVGALECRIAAARSVWLVALRSRSVVDNASDFRNPGPVQQSRVGQAVLLGLVQLDSADNDQLPARSPSPRQLGPQGQGRQPLLGECEDIGTVAAPPSRSRSGGLSLGR